MLCERISALKHESCMFCKVVIQEIFLNFFVTNYQFISVSETYKSEIHWPKRALKVYFSGQTRGVLFPKGVLSPRFCSRSHLS